MAGLLSRIFGRGRTVSADDVKSWTARRWEAADTNRLNASQWQTITGQSINADLLPRLETLRTRSALELARNPILEGVVSGYASDVVGPGGPTLQIQSDDEAYNEAMEAVLYDAFERLDIRGQMGLVELLTLSVRQMWDSGEFLWQKVTDPTVRGPIALRIKVIHPRRLDTPPAHFGDADVIMGIRQTREGRPTHYYIADPKRFGVYELATGEFTELPAEAVIHRFLMLEPDQARGVPWLATPLQSAADLRDYDAQVLDAARAAADSSIFWYTDHPSAPFLKVNEQATIERRTQSTGPPGWKPMQLQPTQPATNYIDFRAERLREIGRPRGVPLNHIRLDSSKHNYSSARYDGQIYLRGLRVVQGWLERRTLNALVDEMRREAELYARANPNWRYAEALARPPADVEYRWTWPVPPHVDPAKEATGERIRLENRTLDFASACAANGTDEDTVIASLARSIRKFKRAGVPLPRWVVGQLGAVDGASLAAALDAQEKAEQQEEADEQAPQENADA